MMVTITRLYKDYAAASAAVRDLEAAGVPSADISLVASNADDWYTRKVVRTHNGIDDTADATEEGAGSGATIGAAIAGGAGLLAGLGVLAIPGLGPVVAAGWLASTAVGALAGAAAGGVTGGIIGALTDTGVSPEEAEVIAEGVRRGGTMVSARVSSEDSARYEAILDRASVSLPDQADIYRDSGWRGFEPTATAYTDEQIRRERDAARRAAE